MTKEVSPKLILHKPTRKYTLEEYLRKEANSTHKHEFINGEIIKMPNARYNHNLIAMNIAIDLSYQTENSDKNYQILGSDQKIYFPSLDEGVYADALAVCEKPLFWDNDDLLLINPILVVEVLSKSTQKYDRSGKFDKYKTLESFKEYVMIRQDICYAEVWYRERPGLWHETIVTDFEGKLPLQSLGVEISMKRIYKNVSF
ncbi:Uma2 family endonuclease [Emticicia sp. W12TSBA100-4]|uniref:Uma2 family endonuclease n=1 Tax=Emticicia sp. W12TSBA100-4 TaxID=3160965 RepID=UPI0033068410